jgi:hypothetical protein
MNRKTATLVTAVAKNAIIGAGPILVDEAIVIANAPPAEPSRNTTSNLRMDNLLTKQ